MAIRVTTLGGLRIERHGVELGELLPQRLRTSLLVYLAVERRARRDTLSSLFWPDTTERKSRQSLRQSLHHVGKILEDEWLDAGPVDLRAVDNLACDAHEFEAALAELRLPGKDLQVTIG